MSSAAPPSQVQVLRFGAVMAMLLAVASFPGSSLFALRAIEVSGARTVSPADVRRLAGLTPGAQPVFRIDAEEVRRRVLRHPWIARAEVRVRPFGTVAIAVEERIPTALVPVGGGYALVDEDGTVIELRAAIEDSLPAVAARGASLPYVAAGHAVPSPLVREGLAVLPLLPEALRDDVARIEVTPEREVVLYTRDRLEVRVGARSGLRERLRLAPEVLRTIRAKGIALEYLDLRVPDNVIIKPRTPP